MHVYIELRLLEKLVIHVLGSGLTIIYLYKLHGMHGAGFYPKKTNTSAILFSFTV